MSGEKEELIRKALATFSRRSRIIVTEELKLPGYNGLTTEHLATIFHISESMVRKILNIRIKKLRKKCGFGHPLSHYIY